LGIFGAALCNHRESEAPPVTDAAFESVFILGYSSQLFDACDWPWGHVFFVFLSAFFLGSVSQLRLKKADIVSFETLGAKHAQFSVRGALEHRSSQPVGI
jgi:hypothetical protein